MDLPFWFSLILGGAIGFIVALFANYYTPGFANLMNRSKVGFVERSKKRALAQFVKINKMKAGKLDRYFSIINSWGQILST